MKVAVYQFAPEFGEKEKNLQQIEEAVLKSEAALIVFPELCTTGYQFVSQEEADALCEPIPDGPTVQRLIQMCQEKDRFIVAGIGEREGDVNFNSCVLIGPKGYIGKYRKVHLFLEEKDWFQPGDLGFHVFDIGLAKIGMMICFDWIFPEAARSLALHGADIICHPVNLVLPYCQEAMITRSIENSVFTITANRIGTEARGGKEPLTFTGCSQIVSPKGERLISLGNAITGLQETDIDPLRARDKHITPRNHILNDRRTNQYNLK